MSFTGTPFISTAIFSCEKPRIAILESPKPPPDFVAYTDGVLFRISGNSWEPNLLWISEALIVDLATGVCLSFAISTIPLKTTSSRMFPSSVSLMLPRSPALVYANSLV